MYPLFMCFKCFGKHKRFYDEIFHFSETSLSRFVYFRFSGHLFPVVMIDGVFGPKNIQQMTKAFCLYKILTPVKDKMKHPLVG